MSVLTVAPAPSPLRTWLLAAFVTTLAGVVTGGLYFAVGGVFALLSDLAALGMGIAGIAIVLGLHERLAATARTASPGVRTLGLLAYGITVLGSLALVVYNLGVQAVPAGLALGTQFLGMTLQGAWLLGQGALVLRTRSYARGIGWMFVVSGVGYLSFGVASALRPGDLAGMAGGFAGVLVYLVLLLRLRAEIGAATD